MMVSVQKKKKIISLVDLFKFSALVLCFFAIDLIFRWQEGMRVLYVSPLDEVPALFDLLYGIIFVTVISLISNKRWKRWIYILVYCFFCLFILSEYIYERIFDRVFGISTLQYAAEAKEFGGIVFSYFDLSTVKMIFFFLVIGLIGWLILPEFPLKISIIGKTISSSALILISILGILVVPKLFKDSPNIENGAFAYMYKQYIYNEWVDNKRALEMFGIYEFLGRDLYLCLQPNEISEEGLEKVALYFDDRKEEFNDMSDVFTGKNVIMILMESIDDWLINEETTPTICRLMGEGISFPNMYTPIFGSGATLNTEFCSYTGLYAPPDGTPLVNYSNNTFSYALPYLFRENGYTAKAFHYNSADFYNRQNIHHAVGFQEYVSYLDYEDDSIARLDTTLPDNELIYRKLTDNPPFFSYVITYTAHGEGSTKPYSHEDSELKLFPEYMGRFESEEMDSISAKSRVTDEMFSRLLENLEEDGLLEDTVIIAFADHYDYMILDQDYLKDISGSDNTYMLSKTPFFIWASGIESQEISKIISTMDIYPTVCNLFGLNNHGYYLGNDVFNEQYKGLAFWQDGSWMCEDSGYYNSTGEIFGMMDDDQRAEIQKMIDEKMEINQLIFDTDFFNIVGKKNEKNR